MASVRFTPGDLMLKFQRPWERTGFFEGVTGQSRRKFKSARRQAEYNFAYKFGSRFFGDRGIIEQLVKTKNIREIRLGLGN